METVTTTPTVWSKDIQVGSLAVFAVTLSLNSVRSSDITVPTLHKGCRCEIVGTRFATRPNQCLKKPRTARLCAGSNGNTYGCGLGFSGTMNRTGLTTSVGTAAAPPSLLDTAAHNGRHDGTNFRPEKAETPVQRGPRAAADPLDAEATVQPARKPVATAKRAPCIAIPALTRLVGYQILNHRPFNLQLPFYRAYSAHLADLRQISVPEPPMGWFCEINRLFRHFLDKYRSEIYFRCS